MKDLLTKDLGWKLLSLSLALAIWLTVHRINEEMETTPTDMVESTLVENLPVLVVSGSGDMRDFRVIPDTVTVTVTGPPDVMGVLQGNQIRAMVDLTDFTNKQGSKDLTRLVEVSAPSRVTLSSITPPKVGIILPPGH